MNGTTCGRRGAGCWLARCALSLVAAFALASCSSASADRKETPGATVLQAAGFRLPSKYRGRGNNANLLGWLAAGQLATGNVAGGMAGFGLVDRPEGARVARGPLALLSWIDAPTTDAATAAVLDTVDEAIRRGPGPIAVVKRSPGLASYRLSNSMHADAKACTISVGIDAERSGNRPPPAVAGTDRGLFVVAFVRYDPADRSGCAVYETLQAMIAQLPPAFFLYTPPDVRVPALRTVISAAMPEMVQGGGALLPVE